MLQATVLGITRQRRTLHISKDIHQRLVPRQSQELLCWSLRMRKTSKREPSVKLSVRSSAFPLPMHSRHFALPTCPHFGAREDHALFRCDCAWWYNSNVVEHLSITHSPTSNLNHNVVLISHPTCLTPEYVIKHHQPRWLSHCQPMSKMRTQKWDSTHAPCLESAR